jgi:beta-lactamase superfamily II metal-dependent hydrolase
MYKRTVIHLSNNQSITVRVDDDGTGVITSTGLKTTGDADSTEEQIMNAAIDGMEALILSLACAGVDISTEAFKTAIISANDALVNNI